MSDSVKRPTVLGGIVQQTQNLGQSLAGSIKKSGLLDRRTKIAITGTANSGKTVFLTSLLWQLSEFDDADFHLERYVKIRGFKEHGSSSDFPLGQHQHALAEQSEWPSKTKDIHRYTAKFIRSDRRLPQQIVFLDFPGERIADAAIAAHDGFDKWSDHMFESFDSDSTYREPVHEYRQALESHSLSAQEAVDSYRKVLAYAVLNYKPLVSPSVFLLDRDGRQAPSGKQSDALARERLCGLNAESQFAPLPRQARELNPELARTMEKRYRRYRKELVLPLFRDLADSDSLIVLVDIPCLLVGGVGRYNDNRQVVLDLFEAMHPDSRVGSLLRKLAFWSPALRRIAFAATKADVVRPSDLQDDRLTALLRGMNNRATGLLAADVDWFCCSACDSTDFKGSHLRGKLNAQGPMMEVPVSALPEEWPEDWASESYQFPEVAPRAPRNLQTPPKHRQLDAIFDFVAMG